MDRTLDPAVPTSSSDDELAARFSGFFSEVTRISSKINAAAVNQEFSIDFSFVLLGLSLSLISDR